MEECLQLAKGSCEECAHLKKIKEALKRENWQWELADLGKQCPEGSAPEFKLPSQLAAERKGLTAE